MLDELRIADYALDGHAHVVEVEGQVDLYSAPELKEHTSRVIEQGKTCVIIDLSRVTFMDSTGLGVLVGALKRLRAARAELLLVVTDYDIERLFELTGLDGTFTIYRSRDDAIEHLEVGRGA
jgi:anti-sigma B factor antagonist